MDATDRSENKSQGPVHDWLAEIAAAQKRERDFRKDGRRVLAIYNGEKADSTPFNILYSNTETLLPALYNSTPRPSVQRRFKDEDPVGKASSQIGQRALEYLVDTNSEEYASFDDVMGDAVLDALLPGRGATRVKYDYESGKVGETEVVTHETVCFESLKWDSWIFGFAKKWKKVPWIALAHAITKEEAEKKFGAAIANKLTYTTEEEQAEDSEEREKRSETSSEQKQKSVKVWEIWDKAGGRKVRFIAECHKEGYLKVDDDPLELTGFFPIPEPLRLHRKSNDQMPTAIYRLYENQAKELNRITVRINKIVEACKVRGVYDSTLSEIAGLLKQDDNTLIGADQAAALQNGGLDKAIWLMPIEKLIAVLQQLYVSREACKRTIYEITGISDILRGASAASETLGAQEIKQNWATLRLKRMQKEVQRYARDVLRITLEIAANKFQLQTFKTMTGLQIPTAVEKQQVAGELARLKAQAAMTPPQPGQPAPQPPAQLVQTMMTPAWEEALGALKNATQRQYKIDIETNSTVDLEATEDKKDLGEMLNAIAQFVNGVGPLVEKGALDINAAKAMLLFAVRKYRMGVDVEEYIKQMKAPEKQDDGKAAAEQARGQIEQMKLQQKDAADKGNAQLKAQEAQYKQQLEAAEFRFTQQIEQQKALDARGLEMAKIEATKAAELAKLQAARATAEMQAKIQQETELKKAALAGATQIQIAQMNARVTAQAQAGEQANVAKQTEVKAQESSEMADMLRSLLETQAKLLESIAAPKETDIKRDKSGKAVSFISKVAVKA